MISVFNIDWLSIYGESLLWSHSSDSLSGALNGTPGTNTFIDNGTCQFEFIRMPYGTRQFCELYSVVPRGSDICCATIQSCPRAGILNPKSVIIKIANYLLYDKSLFSMIDNLLYECSITPKSISRLDLSLDFYEFNNGWTPTELITKYLNKEILHVGKGKSTIYLLEGSRNLTYTGLQLGTKSSDANVYLYNKTYELLGEKGDGHKDKPYIRQCWSANGLNDQKKDVWRLEISFRTEALRFCDKKTKSFYDYSDLKLLDDVRKLFLVYVDKLFNFRIPDNKNISRCTRVDLLGEISDINRIRVKVSKPSFLSDKIFIKKLIMSKEYSRIMENPDLYNHAIQLAANVIESCDLDYWYNKRANSWDLPKELAQFQPLRDWLAKKAGEWDLFAASHIQKQLN